MSETARKPLAHVAAEGRRESMVMWPMRWPPALLKRAQDRANEKGTTRADVIREAVIAGLISIETHEAMQSHRGKTA